MLGQSDGSREPSPVKKPENVDMVIFRENTEDIYAGIEWMHGSDDLEKVKSFLTDKMNVKKTSDFLRHLALVLKPVSKEGTERIVQGCN